LNHAHTPPPQPRYREYNAFPWLNHASGGATKNAGPVKCRNNLFLTRYSYAAGIYGTAVVCLSVTYVLWLNDAK